MSDVFKEMSDYSTVQGTIPVPIDLTYGNTGNRTVGWDHAHTSDQNLLRPVEHPWSYITGPVQILEEGLAVVRSFRLFEKVPIRVRTTHMILEDLMRNVWSPVRVARWAQMGVLDDIIPE
jgi:hypothetical protein